VFVKTKAMVADYFLLKPSMSSFSNRHSNIWILNRIKTVTNVKQLVLSIVRHYKASSHKEVLPTSFSANTRICFGDKA